MLFKCYIAKSEKESKGNLFDVDSQQPPQGTNEYIRKLNIVTLRERPFCAFCSAKVGFTWFTKADSTYSLCTICVKSSNYPGDLDAQRDFTPATLSEEVWERLHKELTPEVENAAKVKPASALTHEQ